MNVLLLSIYPFDAPLHGGQIRAHHIVKTFRAVGIQVGMTGVLGSEAYPRSDGYEPFPGEAALKTVIDIPTLLEDWAVGHLYGTNDKYFKSLAARVKVEPDLIYVEQPWLWRFAQRLAGAMKIKPKLVYGSQNVEHRLKESILQWWAKAAAPSPITSVEIAHKLDLVLECELTAIRQADGVVCVSEGDRDWVLAQRDVPTIVASNGVAAWDRPTADVQAAQKISGDRPYALYCASGHPPNIAGFFEMFGGGFGSLSPDQRLIVAGGAGEIILRSEQLLQSAKLADRYVSAGIVSNNVLGGLLEQAHCMVLPLTEGGGTNLKTAEALWSGHHIVATSKAMRGFERFIDSSGVMVADTPALFKQALRRAMQSPPLKLSVDERQDRTTLLWDECLKDLPAFARKLVQEEVVSE